MSNDPVCTADYIDHIGIVVTDIDTTMNLLQELFDVPPGKITEISDQGVRGVLLEIGETRLELLEPLSADSSVSRFLERRGQGLHHLALRVTNISKKLRALKEHGVDLIDLEPREGLSGTIAFLHPKSIAGILVELVERSE